MANILDLMRKKIIQLLFLFTLIPVVCSEAGQGADQSAQRNFGTEQTFQHSLVIAIDADYLPQTFLNVDGQPTGMFVDIWRLWAQKTGKEITFLSGNWNDTLANLKNGSADIHSGLFFSDSRAEWISFSQPFYVVGSLLFFRAASKASDKIGDFAGKKIGAILGAYQEEYLRKNYPEATVVPFTNREEMIRAVLTSSIDCMLAEGPSMTFILDRRGSTGQFETGRVLFRKSFHAGVLKENSALLSLVNQGFDAISDAELANIEKRWITDPNKRYFKASQAKIRLTEKEKAWINEHSSIRTGFPSDYPPLFLKKDDVILGIMPDYLRLVADYSGLDFQCERVPAKDFDDAIRIGKVDMAAVFDLPERHPYTLKTQPFMNITMVIVGRNNTPLVSSLHALKGKKIAVVRGIKIYNRILKDYPGIERVPTNTLKEALDAVVSAKADAVITGMVMVGHVLQDYPTLKILGLVGIPEQPLIFAVRKDFPELVSIMNKAIAKISKEKRDAIVQKWFTVQIEQKTDWPTILKWVGALTFVFLLILTVFLIWNRKLVREITERRRAESALKESEERFKGLVEQSPFSIQMMDLSGKTVRVNRAWEELWNLKLEDLEGYNLLQDEQLKRLGLMPYIEKAFAGEVSPLPPKEYDALDTLGKGRKRWVGSRAFPVKDSNNNIRNVILMHEDVTTRILAENALRESEEKYRLLIDNATDAIFIAQDGILKFANPKAEKMTGYSGEELSRMPFVGIIHPEEREMVLQRHLKRLKGETPPSIYAFRIINKSGAEFWVELNTVLIHWEERPATLNFLRDVTAQKQLETQLQQAQKMEALGTLAGGIAHDFNNLLMAIQGRVSMMIMDNDIYRSDLDHLKGIESYVKSAADLTQQLLGLARGGKYEIKPTDLNKLIKKEVRMFGRTKKEITLREKYQDHLWPVEIDRGQIQQALLNLYVNAWQAMPGGGDLYLETENVTLNETDVKPFSTTPGRYVKISIADTGIGMDKKTLERIFDPFFTTKEMGRGTGLGLASAYGIIKNHGGFIKVYSEKGEGSRFTIYLPASDKEVIEKKKTAGDLLTGSETVLFVDDEDIITEFAENLLGRLGYKVLIARSGKEAIEIFTENKGSIDMVLLDMVMPDMGGSDTYDRLKTLNPGVKVLLSSGYSIDGQATAILDRGCNGFIQKPFKITELSKKLRDILDDNE